MIIEMIKMHEGHITAIMDNGTGVHLDLIEGPVRTGCQVEEDGERWKVVGNNVNVDCINGVCGVR